MPRSLPPVQFTDPHDVEIAEYRPLVGQAIVGMLLGLLSPLALLDPSLWIVPLLGAFFSLWALRRMKRSDSAVAGRKRALLGLGLSLAFLIAAPVDLLASRRLIRQHAQDIADTWFKLVLEKHLLEARRMMRLPAPSQPAEPTMPSADPTKPPPPKADAEKDEMQAALERFAQSPLIRQLVDLGPRARVRFYETTGQAHQDNSDVVQLTYAVTYDDAGERKSFFVLVDVRRSKLGGSGEIDWRIHGTKGGFRPSGW